MKFRIVTRETEHGTEYAAQYQYEGLLGCLEGWHYLVKAPMFEDIWHIHNKTWFATRAEAQALVQNRQDMRVMLGYED